MLKRQALLSLVLLASMTGCDVSPRLALRGMGGRNSYNIALQTTSNEQLLLNIVRLRYYDVPYFLNVDSITTQFSIGGGLSTKIPIPGFNEDNPGSFGADINWKNQPTIQYTPLEGESFAKHLLQPIDPLLIQYLIYTGWDVDRIFKMTIQSLDGIDNNPITFPESPIQYPEFEQFNLITSLLRQIQMRGDLQVGAQSTKYKKQSCQKPAGEDLDLAYDSGNLRGRSLQIFFPKHAPESEQLLRLLPGIKEQDGVYALDLDLGFLNVDKTGIIPRSVLACMDYLSIGVNIPRYHLGMVDSFAGNKTHKNYVESIRALLDVKVSRTCPKDTYVAVKYKGYWFYISDFDIESKKTFTLLQGLYNLQSGDTPKTAPILTIPLGGR
jgi:hypothetical protein